MTTLISALEDAVLVEYGEFSIIDPEGAEDTDAEAFSSSWNKETDPGAWLTTSDNMLMVQSMHNMHTTVCTLQLWSAAPPSLELLESEVAEYSFYSSSGQVQLEEMMGSEEEHPSFDLGSRNSKWIVRAYRIQSSASDQTSDIDEHFESYFFQFWLNPDQR
ncbi:hypothetical protein AB0F88_12675 [Streptosporangium sp. NPDC023963]|uniref:hypothetical protein n=1 Tax=Streptosporangium sp. NPDC023963 TaxID=3155608 RepID=UPI0034185BF9